MIRETTPWWALRGLTMQVDVWKLVRALGGVDAAAGASAAQWAAAGLPLEVAARLGQAAPPGRWVVPTDPVWPASLSSVPFGPVALQVEGELSRLTERAVAVVGARACTPEGRRRARRIGASFAEAGVVVVSGMARGIDTEAHVGAEGRTIAVLGQGLYARMAGWQTELRTSIVHRGGLVISELDPDTPASRFSFPNRNRIIAGLGLAVVVVEANARSGTRNTARHAMEAGRPVFAVPGTPDAPASAGCLDLIESDAFVFRSVCGVLDRIGGWAPSPLDPLLRRPKTLTELTLATGWSVADTLAAVGGLELEGRLARLPGPRYAWADGNPHRTPRHGTPRE